MAERGSFPGADARRHVRWSIGALLMAVLLGLALAVVGLIAGAPPDRWGEVASALALGTLLITAIAIGVALTAFLATFQEPDLAATAWASAPPRPGVLELPWKPIVRVDELPEPLRTNRLVASRLLASTDFYQSVRAAEGAALQIRLTNNSPFSARNPAVVAKISGLLWLSPDQPGWIVTSEADGDYRLQWDGGSDLAVHGRWSRDLPTVRLAGAVLTIPRDTATYGDGAVELELALVADGFDPDRGRVNLPLRVVDWFDSREQAMNEWMKEAEASMRQLGAPASSEPFGDQVQE
jgi:hypothetical protein